MILLDFSAIVNHNRVHLADGAEICPFEMLVQHIIGHAQRIGPLLQTPMAFVKCCFQRDRAIHAWVFRRSVKVFYGFLQQGGLIFFQSKHIIRFLYRRLARYGPLATHGVCGDDAPFKVEHLHQFRHRRDFIGLLVRRNLPDDDPSIVRPRADHMQRLPISVPASSQCFPVNTDRLTLFLPAGTLYPRYEASLKLLRVHQFKYPLHGIV